MKAPKSEDYIPKDLASQIAQAIAKGIGMGSKQGFSGANFMQDMTSQMDDFVKNQKAREINEKVYNESLAKGITTREAEVRVLAEMAKQENANAIQTLQGKLKNKNLSGEERSLLQDQLETLRQMPGLIDSMTEKRAQQLAIEEKQAKLDKEQEMVKEKYEEINASLKARIGITDELLDQLRTPEMAKALFADAVIGKLDKIGKGFEEFREKGLSAGDAVNAQFKGMSFESMLGLSDTKGVMQGVVEEFGNVNALSGETVNELGKMAHHLGISGQEALKLNASLSQLPGETSETATAAMEHTAHLAEAQGIAGSKVFADMAKNTGAMALYSKGGAEAFGKTAIQLHKMGVEIATAAKMADGLLDFENSISKQMEASVLLGKEINLDKARELALSGDLAGSTAEVLKNIGGSAEFDKMNVMQKKALAEATGMSVEELQKSIDAQEEHNKYFGEGAGLGKKAVGYVMEYGGAAVGFMKENAMLILSSIQLLSNANAMKLLGTVYDKIKIGLGLVYQGVMFAINGLLNSRLLIGTKEFVMEKAKIGFAYVQQGLLQARVAMESFLNNTKVGMWVKEKAHWVAEKAHMAFKIAQERLGMGMKAASGAQAAASTAASAGGAVAGGAGASAGLTSLATGLSAMGTPQVLLGAFNLLVAAPAMVAAVAGIPFLIAISFLGTPAGTGLTALGNGLTTMANPALIMSGANLMAFALASVVGVAGIPFLAIIAMIGIAAGAGLQGLASGLSALANPQVAIGIGLLSILALALGVSIMMMGIGIGIAAAGLSLMFKELANMPLDKMMLLPIALQLMGMGLLTLGVAALIAAPGVLFATIALAAFAAVLALMQPIMAMGGLQALADGLTAIAASAGGLTQVGLAVMGIGAGLGLMALAGLMALPIIGALIGLAAVAPALGALGSIFGGGEDGGEKEDKMQLIADKLDQLIAVASKGGEVNMDGRKVGEIIRLGLNTSNVR